MILRMSAVSLTLMLCFATPVPAAAYSMLAIFETETQGPLDCGNRARGFEGTDVLYGLMDELAAPTTDPLNAGTAMARPIVIRKPLDRCSPALFLALVGRERITRVEIQLFDKQGMHFFTIRMENVRVIRITREAREHGLHEDVVVGYQIFHLRDERTGASASHDFGG
jgi:type VI secretion system Hcp family effector